MPSKAAIAKAAKKNGNGELTTKQKAFVAEYLIDLNATRAAIRAGYAESSAHVTGNRDLLTNPKVRLAVQSAMNERAERTEVTQARVIHELASLAFSNMAEYINVNEDGEAYIDLSNMTPEQSAAIQEITSETYVEGHGDNAPVVKKTKLRLHHRTQALTLLAKHVGLAVDRVEVSGPGGVPLGAPYPIDQVPDAMLRKLVAIGDNAEAELEGREPGMKEVGK